MDVFEIVLGAVLTLKNRNMKNLLTVALSSLILSPSLTAEVPTGSLSINKKVVREGHIPRVSWKINHPVVIKGLVKVTDRKIEVLTKTQVDVYMIGTAVWNHKTSTQTQVKIGNSNWKDVYVGNGIGLDSGVVRATGILEKGQTIQLKAMANDALFTHVGWVSSDSQNSIISIDGDVPKSSNGWGGDSSMEDYMQPYLANGKLKLGPKDLMVSFELTHDQTQTEDKGYDSNDSIVLLRFTEGVDSVVETVTETVVEAE